MAFRFYKSILIGLVITFLTYYYNNKTVDPISSPQKFDFFEIVQYRGYPIEKFEISSQDGYISSLYRMQKKNSTMQEGLIPILLYPGVNCAVDAFIVNFENQSIAYMMANAGLDVWLLSVRGGKYNRNHTTLDPDQDDEFWDFSWQEMGEYDIPAAVDYLGQKLKKKINLLGYSQGSTAILVALSEQKPPIVQYVNQVFLLGPTSFMIEFNNPIFNIAIESRILNLLNYLGFKELVPDDFNLLYFLTKYLIPVNYLIVWNVADSDLSYAYFDKFKDFMARFPIGTSLRTYLHWQQLVKSKKFERYDFGEEKNIKKYGQPTPTSFNLSNINQTLHLYIGNHDLMGNPDNNKILISKLVNANVTSYFLNGGHLTFCIARNSTFIEQIINTTKSYSNINETLTF